MTEWVTMSPIELSWTAKKTHIFECFQKVGLTKRKIWMTSPSSSWLASICLPFLHFTLLLPPSDPPSFSSPCSISPVACLFCLIRQKNSEWRKTLHSPHPTLFNSLVFKNPHVTHFTNPPSSSSPCSISPVACGQNHGIVTVVEATIDNGNRTHRRRSQIRSWSIPQQPSHSLENS